ncbi:hypothetical protein V1478_001726 [Vespula squamosa]|uniref:Maturase K n=1 Tax=Vespula squamosa TaxID=30214 RepID=A0ABD2BY21_VESSQ
MYYYLLLKQYCYITASLFDFIDETLRRYSYF